MIIEQIKIGMINAVVILALGITLCCFVEKTVKRERTTTEEVVYIESTDEFEKLLNGIIENE